MKNNQILLLAIFLIGCNSRYIIPHRLINAKYEIKSTGVNIRIANNGETYFTKLEIKCDSLIYEFCGLKSGRTSGYQNLPFLSKKSSIKVWGFSKHNKFTGFITSLYIDTNKIRTGYITIFVTPVYKKKFTNNKKTNQWSFNLKIISDEYPNKKSLKLTK